MHCSLSRVSSSPRISASLHRPFFLSLYIWTLTLSASPFFFSFCHSRSLYLTFSRSPISILLFAVPPPLTRSPGRPHVPHVVQCFLFFSDHLLLSPRRSPSVRGTNRRVPRDTLVSRALAGEKSRNDVTLLGRNRESRVNPDRRDHPVRQEPKVFPGTRAGRGFQAKLAHQGRRARLGRSGPSARRDRQELRVLRWVGEIKPRRIRLPIYSSSSSFERAPGPRVSSVTREVSSDSKSRASLGRRSLPLRGGIKERGEGMTLALFASVF